MPITDTKTIAQLVERVQIGDLVFICVRTPPFMQVADSTGTWTNHVGVVVDEEGTVAESRFPLSGMTTLRRFIRRSARGRVAIARLRHGLDRGEQRLLVAAASKRTGLLYDTGFNIRSTRQFCSRFAREVIAEATGQQIGQEQSFEELLRAHPDAPLWFWTLWYCGEIPWQRRTITPASLLHSPAVRVIFDGTTGGAFAHRAHPNEGA